MALGKCQFCGTFFDIGAGKTNEPGTGEIHYKNVLRAIRQTGFKDFVAMEYVPSKDAMLTLAEVRELAFGA